MAAVIEKKEGNKVYFNFEIAGDDFASACEKAYLKARKDIVLPGFRKGRVPRQIIERNFGKDVFYNEALDIILPDLYENILKELDLKPIDYPNFDIDGEIVSGNPVKMKGNVDVRPELELKKYKGLEIEKKDFQVTDEHVDRELDAAREKNARLVDESDRPVEKGDVLTIDYAGFVGEEQFEGGTAENQTLEIGSGAFIPGFEDQLIGKKVGDDVEVKVTFPSEYHADHLAGKEAVFKVKVHELKKKLLPDLDDEFVKDVSEFDTLTEYKDSIRKRLEEEFKNQEEAETEHALVHALIEANEFEVPSAMVRNQLNEEIENFAYRLQMQGLNLDDYMKYTGTSIESLKMQMEPMAKERVKQEMILDAVATAEKIEATDAEVDEDVENAASYLKDEDKEKFKADLKAKNLSYIQEKIKMRKAMALVKEHAVFK